MDLGTILNGGMLPRLEEKMNIAGTLEPGWKRRRVREDEEPPMDPYQPGQPELFDSDTTAGLDQKDLAEDPKIKALIQKYEGIGQHIAETYSDKIFEDAKRALAGVYRDANIDLEAQAKNWNATPGEEISENDSFYEATAAICRAFLQGMNGSWPFPIME